MKILVPFLAAVLSVLLMTFAHGADLNVLKAAPQPYASPLANWQGLYLDAYFQYGADITNTSVFTPGGGDVIDLSGVPHGPGFGGALGYNFDTGTFVWGVRADISWLNLASGSGNLTIGGVNQMSASAATNYLGNADILFGVPCSSDRKLLCYAVGGFAFGGVKASLTEANFASAVSTSSVGWNVGAGLRYQLTPNLHAFIEGDYYDLGDKQVSLVDSAGTPFLTNSAKYHIITQKGGISLKF